MKIVLTCTAFLLLLAGCKRELSLETPAVETRFITASVQGTVYDENDDPAAGVTVKAGSLTSVTDAEGHFRMLNAELNSTAALVTAEKQGYFKAYRNFPASAAANQVSFKLMRKNVTGTIAASTGGEVALNNGSKVTLSPNSIVLASSGQNYSGAVKVFITYIDPTAADIDQIVPGSFMADSKSGKRVLLSSYGMMNVELESAGGEKLQIATGKSATLTTAIPATLQGTAPAIIPLWYVDNVSGIWKEEGSAVRSGSVYKGEVKHFTPWNCDIIVPSVLITGSLQTAQHLPLANTLIRITSVGVVNMSGQLHTDSLGGFTAYLPMDQRTILDVFDPCGRVVYTENISSYPRNTDVGILTMPAINSAITIKGSLMSCNSVQRLINGKGFAVIEMDRQVHYAAVDANGVFSSTFIQCSRSQNVARVYGVETATMLQGPPKNVTITGSVTDAGTINACGPALMQYINFDLDGVNHIILDSLDAYTGTSSNSPVGTQQTYIFGKGPLSSDGLIFHVDNASGPGTYSFSPTNICNYHSMSYQNSRLIFASFPAPGGYYEGSFSMNFTETANNTQHVLSGTFKVKRRF